ncbi:hypothetical protein PLIP_a0801 [Pseudoalteromonas lipolytica LMEB 39]|nr:hypothetical protein [Pseudoalteromonas lipolytica LMEB 39]
MFSAIASALLCIHAVVNQAFLTQVATGLIPQKLSIIADWN